MSRSPRKRGRPGANRHLSSDEATSVEKRRGLNEPGYETSPTLMKLPRGSLFKTRHVIRCHRNDTEDEEVMIWQSSFEPRLPGDEHSGFILASCGGRVVSFTDCDSGVVMKGLDLSDLVPGTALDADGDAGAGGGRKSGDERELEELYTLAWTTLTLDGGKQANVLAVAGYLGYIYLILPAQLIAYDQLDHHGNAINFILFHPSHPTWLFSGSQDNTIVWCDIGLPKAPNYDKTAKVLHRFTLDHAPLNLAFSVKHNLLLYTTAETCGGFVITSSTSKSKSAPKQYTFEPPRISSPYNQEKEAGAIDTYDGLVVLTDDLVATKRCCEGVILVWSLSKALTGKSVTVEAKLLWSDTQVPYIYITYNRASGTLLAGDQNMMWVYHLYKLLNPKHSQPALDPSPNTYYLPSRVFSWPDSHCDDEGVIVNSVCLSDDGKYMAATTSNNYVGIFESS